MNEVLALNEALKLVNDLRIDLVSTNKVGWEILWRVKVRLEEKAERLAAMLLSE